MSTKPVHIIATSLPTNTLFHVLHDLVPILHENVVVIVPRTPFVELGLGNGVEYLLEADDPTGDLPARFPDCWIEAGDGIEGEEERHEGLVDGELSKWVGADGVDGFLPLDEALEVLGFGVDGGDFAVEGADAVGAERRLDGEDGVGIVGLGRGRVVIVGDGGGGRGVHGEGCCFGSQGLQQNSGTERERERERERTQRMRRKTKLKKKYIYIYIYIFFFLVGGWGVLVLE